MNRMRALSTVAATLLATAGLAAADDLVGKPAPDFALKDLSGKEYSLKALRGKIVVLEWANKDCPIWRGVLGKLNKTCEDYATEDQNIIWLAIDSTHNMKPEDNQAFMKEKGVTRPVLDDREGTVGKAFKARTTPHMFIIDKDGKVVYDGAFDNQTKGDQYVNYVAKALDELKAGKPVGTARTNPYGCSVKYKP